MTVDALPPPRLFLLLARSAKRGVVFRRGPSKWTRLIGWDTESDDLDFGHWFHGRIYERRCDLSPDGTKLLYFASKFKAIDPQYTHAWTAVSRPPWLTALALWPKGDCWHGGGLFEDERTVMLNHKPHVANAHPSHTPTGLVVRPNPNAFGEDEPLFSTRLERDGWVIRQEWKIERLTYPRFFATHAPEIRIKHHPQKDLTIVLTRRLDELRYTETFAVESGSGTESPSVAHADWVDWDQLGRLVVLRDGALFVGTLPLRGSITLRQLADFRDQTPETMQAPAWARTW